MSVLLWRAIPALVVWHVQAHLPSQSWTQSAISWARTASKGRQQLFLLRSAEDIFSLPPLTKKKTLMIVTLIQGVKDYLSVRWALRAGSLQEACLWQIVLYLITARN